MEQLAKVLSKGISKGISEALQKSLTNNMVTAKVVNRGKFNGPMTRNYTVGTESVCDERKIQSEASEFSDQDDDKNMSDVPPEVPGTDEPTETPEPEPKDSAPTSAPPPENSSAEISK
jgi:hypothetical protein